MSTVTGDFSINFTGLSNVDPYTNSNLTALNANTVKVLSGAAKNSGFVSGTYYRYNGAMSSSATLRAKLEVGTNGTSGDTLYVFLMTSGGNGYWARVSGTALVIWRLAALAGDLSIASATLPAAPVSGDQIVLELNQTTHTLTAYVNGVSKATGTDSTYTSGLAFGFGFESNNGNASTALSFAGDGVVAVAAVISGPTPSGTLGTTTTATIGATTDQNTGTFYAVLATSSGALTGITAAQIKAGNLASGSAAPFSGSAAVSTTSPSVGITGLTGNTTYYYAIVQNNSNGDSNVINTGSFTTAVAYRSFSITLRDASGVLLNGVNLKFWTRTTKDGAAVDGGSTGLSITCGSNGVFSSNTLTIAAGTYYLFWEDPSDPYKSHWKIHDFT